MCYQVCLGVVAALALFSVIDKGYALQCWTCSSEFDITCKDHFDIPRIQENVRNINEAASQVVNENSRIQPIMNYPHLTECDETKYSYDLRNTCQKKIVVKNYTGELKFVRQCRLVRQNLVQGACPEENDANETLYCSTCDTDGCNSANAKESRIFLAAAISTILMLLLRH